MSPEPRVLHSTVEKKFYVSIDGKECKAEYDLVRGDDGKDVMDIYHTFVPEQLRGQGIAKKIFLEIVKFLDANGMKVRPSCSYALKFFSEDKYRKYVENDISNTLH